MPAQQNSGFNYERRKEKDSTQATSACLIVGAVLLAVGQGAATIADRLGFSEPGNDQLGTNRGAPSWSKKILPGKLRDNPPKRSSWLHHRTKSSRSPEERSERSAATRMATNLRVNRNSAKASLKFPAKASVSCATSKRNFVQTPQDIFVTPEIVRRFQLRDGMWIYGETRRGNRGPQLTRLLKINDEEPTKYQDLRPFEELTTINPNERIKLETVPDRFTTRIMDLMTPLGKGQRGLIVAPPRTGKTTLLHHIADAVVKNHPEMKLIILLVDERPEEVTDFRRSCPTAETHGQLERQRHQESHSHRAACGRTREAIGRSRQRCFHPARFDHPHGARL